MSESKSSGVTLPRFFRVRQTFQRPRVLDVTDETARQLSKICPPEFDLAGKSIAITVGSRGVAAIAEITRACVDFFHGKGAQPFIVPAMGSHGGATAEGQAAVLERFGINADTMDCPIKSSMEAVEICRAKEGFPVYFDCHALAADHVLVVNRIKPHTRFSGAIESGLMKMMLIGLGKQRGAEVYHRANVNYPFDQIVRSVANEVIARCKILGGLAILENGYEETAEIAGVRPLEIESHEAVLLQRVKGWMPKLPFDQCEFLIVDRIGKNISGSGMDTNIIGRKGSDHAAINGERPDIHHIYIRGLTAATHGNGAGVGMAELCHRRVVESIDHAATRMNCITAGHITGAMLPVDFENDKLALQTACQLSGYVLPQDASAMWIRDTLSLEEVECSEYFFDRARTDSSLEILSQPTPLTFDDAGDLIERF